MDASKLALTLLEWERLKLKLEGLEQTIRVAVLDLGKTQTVGNVRASYSKGRKTYNYPTAGSKAAQEIIARHTQPVTDWRAVCKDEDSGIGNVPFTQSAPSVSVKLLE